MVVLSGIQNVKVICGELPKLQKASSCLTICPHGTTELPLGGFQYNLIFEYFKNSVQNIQLLFDSDKDNGYFT